MRLHTNFREDYDSAIGFGIDEKVHYERVTKQVDIRLRMQVDWPLISKAGLIGFCGQVFPFIKQNKYKRVTEEGRLWRYEVIDSYYAYSLEDYLRKWIEWEKCIYFDYLDNSRKIKIRQFFADWDLQSNETFLEFRVPTWAFRFQPERDESNGIINPILKDHQFDRIKDAATAFQDISMYLSNILIEQKEVAQVEDRFRIEQHGFDLRTSFRKLKGNK